MTSAQNYKKDVAAILKRALPFQLMPESLMDAITALVHVSDHKEGELIYEVGDVADDIFIVVSGAVAHELSPESGAKQLTKIIVDDGLFGFAALIKKTPYRLAKVICRKSTQLIRINGEQLLHILESDPRTGNTVMGRLATIVSREFDIPAWFPDRLQRYRELTGWSLTRFRISQWLRGPQPYLMVVGFVLVIGFWYLASEVWKLPRFRQMPGPSVVVTEWLSKNPVYGVSLYTPDYYTDILSSVRRIAIAFSLATGLGVPLGLMLGWSKSFRSYVFPIFEMLRPIPILAWVPLAILMFSGTETPVIFLVFLASFFATALNTMLGVESIDESYTRAAACLGASRWQTFRHVIIPGAMPYIFTGLQISIGVSWFSLVAGEMVSGQYGLGYLINTSYSMVRYPTIIIGMVTLGAVGYLTSTLVRIVGDQLMQYRVRELALGGK